MKLLIIGDLHGNMPRLHFRDFDAIVLVGDICSDKELSPIIKKWFHSLKVSKKEISFSLFLEESLGKKKIKKMEKNSLRIGRKILEKLNSFGKPIFMVPGNWDQSYGKSKIKNQEKNDYNYIKSFWDYWLGNKINSKLVKGLKNIVDCQYKNSFFNSLNFMGYGLVSSSADKLNLKSFKFKKRKFNSAQIKRLENASNKISEKLEKMFLSINKNFPVVFISHNIPYGTKLDLIRDKKNYAYGKHLGSVQARDFCKRFKPFLCIGGHIHEGVGKDKIGKTLVINPGYGKDAQVLVEIEKSKIKNVKFFKQNLK